MNDLPETRSVQDSSTQLLNLTIDGMTCGSCVLHVEKALKALPGVDAVTVNLATEKANIRFFGKSFEDFSKLAIQAVKKSGYEAELIHADDFSLKTKKVAWFSPGSPWPFILAAILAFPLAVPMILMPFAIHLMLPAWGQFLLALPVQIVFGARFYIAAYKAVRSGTANMDLLVALGTSAAFGLSLYSWSQGMGHELYFEASAVVITFVLLGKWLEARAKLQTTQAIRALQAMWPQSAKVLTSTDGSTSVKDVPLDQVLAGDMVVIFPGERVPVDGVVEEGAGTIDESMLSGESIPVEKVKGIAVTGGSMNGESRLLVKATSVGVESTLAKMIRMVENAQAQKASIQRLVDQVSAWFVPAVLFIALLTLILNVYFLADIQVAIIRAVSVMVIACPCALGLATPAAIMVGTGVAAGRGILIKDAQMLEVTHRLNVVVFDKTGTVTEGHPTLLYMSGVVHEQLKASELEIHDFLATASALQAGSEHPLGKAVIQAFNHQYPNSEGYSAKNIRAIPGVGIEGQMMTGPWLGQTLRLISHHAYQENSKNLPQVVQQLSPWLEEGRTISWLMNQADETLAVFVFGDDIKQSAYAAMAHLKSMGIKTIMLSGDNSAAAQYIGRKLGMSEVYGAMLPQNKATWIFNYKQAHPLDVLAMVGDGINDAPALAAADVGMAMASGTDVAMSVAGITLMRGDLNLIAQAIELSKRTWRKIQENLFWAFIFNVVGIPLAALGFLTPVVAGMAMAFSSVTVLSNALLLKRVK